MWLGLDRILEADGIHVVAVVDLAEFGAVAHALAEFLHAAVLAFVGILEDEALAFCFDGGGREGRCEGGIAEEVAQHGQGALDRDVGMARDAEGAEGGKCGAELGGFGQCLVHIDRHFRRLSFGQARVQASREQAARVELYTAIVGLALHLGDLSSPLVNLTDAFDFFIGDGEC